MKVCEAKQSERERWPGKTKPEVKQVLTYVDYIKKSDYNNTYKRTCIENYYNLLKDLHGETII